MAHKIFPNLIFSLSQALLFYAEIRYYNISSQKSPGVKGVQVPIFSQGKDVFKKDNLEY